MQVRAWIPSKSKFAAHRDGPSPRMGTNMTLIARGEQETTSEPTDIAVLTAFARHRHSHAS